jgi:hypothetical protein
MGRFSPEENPKNRKVSGKRLKEARRFLFRPALAARIAKRDDL